MASIDRQTADLSAYPDLVVIYLGMRANRLAGLKTLLGFGPKIARAAGEMPRGLLRHEPIVFSLFPPHIGMRQYWRDFESLEQWTRSGAHRAWWQSYLRDTGGTGFWHETYFVRGGMESIFIEWKTPSGFSAFAPMHAARGPMFSARERLRLGGEPGSAAPVTEHDLESPETS